VLLENQHCESGNRSSSSNGHGEHGTRQAASGVEPSQAPPPSRPAGRQQQQEAGGEDACAAAPKVNEPQFDSACYNGGLCRPAAGGANFTCQCPAGFGGPLCETNIDDCVDHQCQNGAMCVDGINSYKCICRDPTTSGEFCEQLNSNNNNHLVTPFGAHYATSSAGQSANSIAPLALPIIIAQTNGVAQSNELTAQQQQQSEPQPQQQQQLHNQRSYQPQIQARSADFIRQPDDLASNSLQPAGGASNKNQAGAWKACHRATTSRYFDDGNGCQSVRLLKINECLGSCEPKSAGACCAPTKIKRRRIHMQCSDGASYVKVVDLVKKCSCSQEAGSCPANNNNSDPLAAVLGQQQATSPRASAANLTSGPGQAHGQYFKYSTGASERSQQAPAASAGQSGSSGLDGDQIASLDAVD
jgi:hypothetical protein